MSFGAIKLLMVLGSVLVFCQHNATTNRCKDSGFGTHDFKNKENRTKKKPSQISDIALPNGYFRENTDSLSFAFFLRNLELDTLDNTIYAYDGRVISSGGYHHAIIKIDIGKQDLQQCADAVMRLRAEYLYKQKKYKSIHFNFLSDGKPRYFSDYAKGDFSYKKFRKYMDYIFSYANTASLIKELKPVDNVNDMQIGDVFIQKGNPIGHAVIVVDMATEKSTGKKLFLLAQSYMPAQSIHVLSNQGNSQIDPWYALDFEDPLELPIWTFFKKDLKRFN
jgi:hypothetical protein